VQQAAAHELPALAELGFSREEIANAAADARAVMPFVGGEAAGLARMHDYIWCARDACLPSRV
jgi:hypothetical protein